MLAGAVPYLKFAHFCALLVWCAGLLALPSLLALYPAAHGRVARERAITATRFTYIAIASPAAVLAVASGTLLVHPVDAYQGWLLAKLTLVAGMVGFHIACGTLMTTLHDRPRRFGAGLLQATVAVPLALIGGVLATVLWQPRIAGF